MEFEIANKNVLRKVVDDIISDYKFKKLRSNFRQVGDLTFKLDGREITVTTSKDDYKLWRRHAIIFIGREEPREYSEMYFFDTNWTQKEQDKI